MRPATARFPVKLEEKKKVKANMILTTVNLDQHVNLNYILSLKAPKRKQQVLIPKNKRIKKRQRSSSEEEGTKLYPIVSKRYDSGIPGVPLINKKDWHFFKPWVEEPQPLPPWAQTLKEADLKTVITKDSKKGQEGIKDQVKYWEHTKNLTSIPPSFWKHFKLNQKLGESGVPEKPESRLDEIYKQFAIMMAKYKEQIKLGINLGEGENQYKVNPPKMEEEIK